MREVTARAFVRPAPFGDFQRRQRRGFRQLPWRFFRHRDEVPLQQPQGFAGFLAGLILAFVPLALHLLCDDYLLAMFIDDCNSIST